MDSWGSPSPPARTFDGQGLSLPRGGRRALRRTFRLDTFFLATFSLMPPTAETAMTAISGWARQCRSRQFPAPSAANTQPPRQPCPGATGRACQTQTSAFLHSLDPKRTSLAQHLSGSKGRPIETWPLFTRRVQQHDEFAVVDVHADAMDDRFDVSRADHFRPLFGLESD